MRILSYVLFCLLITFSSHKAQIKNTIPYRSASNPKITANEKRNEIRLQVNASILNSNSNKKILSGFKVNDDNDIYGTDQHSPVVARGKNGRMIVAWIDYRNGKPDAYAQILDQNGATIGDNFMLNLDPDTQFCYNLDISSNYNGDIFITWREWGKLGMRRFDPELNNPTGSIVESSGYISSAVNSNITLNDNGTYLITFCGHKTMYGRVFKLDGSPIGESFLINQNTENYSNLFKYTSVDKLNNYLVVYSSTTNDTSAIYLKKYNFNGSPVGPAKLINKILKPSTLYRPSIFVGKDSSFCITWVAKDTSGSSRLMAQIVSHDGENIGISHLITENYELFLPLVGISMDDDFNYKIIWNNISQYYYWFKNNSLKSSTICNYGTSHTEPTNVNLSPQLINVGEGQLVTSVDGNLFLVVEDISNGSTDIKIQKFSKQFLPINGNHSIINDRGSASQYRPSLAVNKDGSYINAWTDDRNGYSDIYAQIFDSYNNRVGNNFKINANGGGVYCGRPKVKSDAAGNYYIIWNTWPDYTLYIQKVSYDGVLVNGNVEVNKNINEYTENYGLEITAGNEIIVYWENYFSNERKLLAQRFNDNLLKDGHTVIYPFKFNSDYETSTYYNFAFNNNAELCMVWKTTNHSEVGFEALVHAHTFSRNGLSLMGPTVIASYGNTMPNYPPEIFLDKADNFMVTWFDNNWQPAVAAYIVYIQRIDSHINYVGNLLSINVKPTLENSNSFGNSLTKKDSNDNLVWIFQSDNKYYGGIILDSSRADINPVYITSADYWEYIDFTFENNKIYYTWEQHPTQGHGYDVWMDVNSNFAPIKQKDPENCILYNNYPNPMNGITYFSYSLPISGLVQLKLYDVLGREIAVLVNQIQNEGFYKIQFNTGTLPSGVYFYQLVSSGFKKTKKMIILR